MAQSRQGKWDARHAKGQPSELPCTLLHMFSASLPPPGRALDLACGLGGNALFLARRGWQCEALDFSATAVEKLNSYARACKLLVVAKQQDLEAAPVLPHNHFDIIVVSYYLHRPLLPAIAGALKPGGKLLYQTFNQRRPQMGGPQDPEFLLVPGELPQRLPGLIVEFENDDFQGRADRPAVTAIILRKPLT